MTERMPSVAGKPFVGRALDLAELRAAMDGAVDGNGSLVLLVGEPGIGKTRLAEQAAADGASRGIAALWGRTWEGGGAPPFWPWIQILRQLMRQLDRTVRNEPWPGDPIASLALALEASETEVIQDPGLAAV